MSFLVVWFCWIHKELKSNKRKPKCCNGDVLLYHLTLSSSSGTIFNLILKSGHKLSFTQSTVFWVILQSVSVWNMLEAFKFIYGNYRKSHLLPYYHFLKRIQVFFCPAAEVLSGFTIVQRSLQVQAHQCALPAISLDPDTSDALVCLEELVGLSHLHVHFQLWVVQQFLGFCVGVTPRNMQTMPCRASASCACLGTVQVIKLQKLCCILCVLNGTFMYKNLWWKLVASVAFSCVTWVRKALCWFKHRVSSQPDFHSASTAPAWLVAGFFCSRSIFVVHLRPWTHPQYSLSQVTIGKRKWP